MLKRTLKDKGEHSKQYRVAWDAAVAAHCRVCSYPRPSWPTGPAPVQPPPTTTPSADRRDGGGEASTSHPASPPTSQDDAPSADDPRAVLRANQTAERAARRATKRAREAAEVAAETAERRTAAADRKARRDAKKGQHFKSAPCFRDIHNHSFLAPRDGVPVNRTYTASGHGKGEHDGAATYVKSSVKKHLLTVEGKFGSKGIRSAQECFDWCRDYLPAVAAKQQQWSSKKGAVKLHDRRFIYVDTSDVERPDKITWEVDDRVGALHELMFRPGKEEMHGRDLTCVCAQCRAGKYASCCWGAWVDLPRHVRMKTAAKGKQSQAALREIECRCRSVNESRDCVHCRRKKIGV